MDLVNSKNETMSRLAYNAIMQNKRIIETFFVGP
jgi:hypothetical protein